jgi:Flp pilus assembly protein CpaB
MPARADLARARSRLRRAVLRRRRLIAAVLLAVAVVAGLHVVAAPPPPTVAVLAAGRDLPAGTLLDDDDLARVALPAQGVPDGATTALGDAVGRTLAAPVRRGEPLTDVRLVGTPLATADPGLTALPVRLPDAGAVRLLAVGDRIDLLATDPQSGTTDTVAARAIVLALPAPAGTTGAEPPGALVVVGVEPVEVAAVSGAAARLFLGYAYAR